MTINRTVKWEECSEDNLPDEFKNILYTTQWEGIYLGCFDGGAFNQSVIHSRTAIEKITHWAYIDKDFSPE